MKKLLGVFGIIAGLCLAGPVLAQTATHTIHKVAYNPETAQLLVEYQDGEAYAPEHVTHSSFWHTISFVLPYSTMQPATKTLTIAGDPLVKSIAFMQTKQQGAPAVSVKVSLYTHAPNIPFTFSEQGAVMQMAFTRAGNESVAVLEQPQPKPVVNTPVVSEPQKPASQPVISSAEPIEKPQPPAQEQRMFMFHPQPDEATTSTPKIYSAFVPSVGSGSLTVIKDIFFEDNTLSIMSGTTPIIVKNAFTLAAPNRYVVDISPAVLASKSLNRAVLDSNPHILSIKMAQFDENTVRVVVQFAGAAGHVSMAESGNNKILKLNF